MAREIFMSVHGTEWERMGLDCALDSVADGLEFRNERPSGFGDDEGEWFAVCDDFGAPDDCRYNILFFGTHGNDHSPMTSGNTYARLYNMSDPAESAEFAADVAEWEAKPEYDPDYQGDDEESDQGYWRIVTPQGVACVDADLVPAIEPTPQDFLPHMPAGHQLPDYDSGDPADSWQYEYHEGPIPDSESRDS